MCLVATTARYTFTLSATGGNAPLTWAIDSGSPPAGITLDAATGTLSGTSTAIGTVGFAGRVTDASIPAQSRRRAVSALRGDLQNANGNFSSKNNRFLVC